jgi:hypothetical protein
MPLYRPLRALTPLAAPALVIVVFVSLVMLASCFVPG